MIEKVILPEADFLQSLNEQQKEAVNTFDGPLLVLSGAGTGKTKVLTSRIANLIFSRMASTSEILAVTFTNKAAFEMKNRVENLLKRPVEGMFIGTFHSIGVRILRKHAELVSLKRDFTILDTDDQIRLIKQVLDILNLDKKKYVPKNYLYFINQLKNLGLDPEKISSHEFQNFSNGKLKGIYSLYQERLKIFNAVDFGDLILHPLNLLKENKNLLNQYHSKFKYILVDEYQDTNASQYLFLRLLAEKNRNICCVGDEDQSIYGWRGAQLKNILNFEKDFPGSKIIRLEQNYRSSANILAAASNIISENTERIGKKLWTSDLDGEKVNIINVENDEIEAYQISEKIKNLNNEGVKSSEIAILTRASFQFKEIEDRFLNENIRYRVVGGLKFYERKEIKDAISFFRILINESDNLALERVVNLPKRGIGKSVLAKANENADKKNLTLFASFQDLIHLKQFTNKVIQNLKLFFKILDNHRIKLTKAKNSEVAGSLLDDIGYTEMLLNDKTPESEGKLENLKKLIVDIEKRESISEFLEEVSLVIDNSNNDENKKKVSLMTLHSAKGLEFEYIFLPGWEEGIFPNQRTIDETGNVGLEEERRLAYVGITRARLGLSIFYCNYRKQYNQSVYRTIPSRFLSELPQKNCEVKIININQQLSKRNKSSIKKLSSKFIIGDKVFHESFGNGIVLGTDFEKIQVKFENSSEIIKLLSSYLKKVI